MDKLLQLLFEQYPAPVALGFIALGILLQIGFRWASKTIDNRSLKRKNDLELERKARENELDIARKKEEIALDETLTEVRIQSINDKEQLALLKVQYEQLAETAKLGQNMIEEKNATIDYLTPIAERAMRAEDAYDLLKEQNDQQSVEISRLNITIEERDALVQKLRKELVISYGVLHAGDAVRLVTLNEDLDTTDEH